jgi:DNA-directed RNA polymerase specialized sigma24 family protein
MPASDQLLRPYLECPDEPSADDLLAGLLFDHAEPLVRGVLQRRLRGAAGAQDHEDLTGEVILELLVRLRRDRLSAGACPIESFRAYVTTAAHHACDGFFRRRRPQRHHLKNRIRYVLRQDPRFAIWTDANGTTACGWARWEGQPAGDFSVSNVPAGLSDPLELALEAIFEDAGAPVELDDAAGFLAAAWGIREARAPLESIGGHAGDTADPASSLDNRRRLERLWAGIVMLPLPQRLALLLHLRDDRGGPALALLPASGVASIPRVAEALEMPVAELAELWNRLPLGDAEIAPRLRLNRQQVINLRSAARQRLARSDEWLGGAKRREERGNVPRNQPSL